MKTARRNHDIAGHSTTVEDPNLLTFSAATRYLDVSDTTIKRLVAAGLRPMSQLAPFAPWETERARGHPDRRPAVHEDRLHAQRQLAR